MIFQYIAMRFAGRMPHTRCVIVFCQKATHSFIIGLLLIGAAFATAAAVIVGKFLHWNPWLSAAVGVTCLLGYPFTYAIAMEAVNGSSFGKNFSEEEIQRLTNYVLPKMVIGGVVSVSIVSVIIAAYIGPMIF